MYSEKTFKNYIFWIQVKRVFIIILLSCIGAALGVFIGKFIESAVNVFKYSNLLIIALTVVFFLISLLLTSSTGKEVQDAYWKMAVLRKLTVIQKNLEAGNKDLNLQIDEELREVNPKLKSLESTKKLKNNEQPKIKLANKISNLNTDTEENVNQNKEIKKRELKKPEEIAN